MAARRLATTPETLPFDALEPAMKPLDPFGAGGSGRRDVIATRPQPANYQQRFGCGSQLLSNRWSPVLLLFFCLSFSAVLIFAVLVRETYHS